MPPVVAGEVQVVLVRNGGGVECAVVRMSELDVLQSLILRHKTIANDLDLRLVRNGLQVRVQDATLGIESLSMAIGVGLGIEALSELELRLGRDMSLVLEDKNLIVEESITDHIKVGI